MDLVEEISTVDILSADETCTGQIVLGIHENWYFSTRVRLRSKGVSDQKVQNYGIYQKLQKG